MSYHEINEKIINGDYKSKLELPARVKKPTMSTSNVTPEAARKFADDLEAYNSSIDAVNTAKSAYHADVNRLENVVFRADLADAYGLKDHPKEKMVWEKAWEHGHGNGLSEVLYWYDEFADVAK